MEKTNLPDSPSFVDLCTLHQHAMRYYRLWIYACNTVLAVATLVFTVFAVSVVVDPRITLISGVELYQPTFLYAYVALLLQCGVLQTIGCLGALRLNQRLLNLYWTLLLVLMIGDIIVGLIWAFRLDRIKNELRPSLKLRLETEYGRDPEFTQVWDWVQSHEMCCGVTGPEDFNATRVSDSAAFALSDYTTAMRQDSSTTTAPSGITFLPATCCTLFNSANFSSLIMSSSSGGGGLGHGGSGRRGSVSHLPVEARRSQQNIFQVGGGAGGGSSTGTTINLSNVNAHTRRRIVASGRRHHEAKTDASNKVQQQQHLTHGIPPNNLPLANRQSQIYPQLFQDVTTESYQSTQSSFPGMCQLPPHLLASLTSKEDEDNNNFSSSPSDPSTNLKSRQINSKDLKDSNSVLRKSRRSSSSSESSSNQWNLASTSSTQAPPVLYAPPSLSSSSSASPYAARWESSPETTFPTPPAPSFSSSSTSTTTRIPLHVLLQQKQLILHGHHVGCAEKILEWLDHVTDILFVIGFCIIVFLKGCFLAILRYEIKEMIQKIRLLNGEDALRSATMNELIGLTSIYAHDQSPVDGGGGDGGENGDGGGGGSGGDSSSAALLGDKRQQGGGGGNGAAESTLITTMDSSLSNNTKHHHHHHHHGPHIVGNHVGGGNKERQHDKENIIEEDFDSSSALLGRVNSGRGRPFEKSASLGSAPSSGARTFTLPKNGNNNLTTTAAAAAASATTSSTLDPPPPSYLSNAP